MITGELAELRRGDVPLAFSEETFREGMGAVVDALQAQRQRDIDIITDFVRNGDSEWTLRHWLKYDEERTEADSLLTHRDGSVSFVSLALRGVHASIEDARATAKYCDVTEFPKDMFDTMQKRAEAEPKRTLLGIISKAASPDYPDDMPDSFLYRDRLDDDAVSELLLDRWNDNVRRVTVELGGRAPKLSVEAMIASAKKHAADEVAEGETKFNEAYQLLIQGAWEDPSRTAVAELMLGDDTLKQRFERYLICYYDVLKHNEWGPLVIETLARDVLLPEYSPLRCYVEGSDVLRVASNTMKVVCPTVGAIALGPSPSQSD